MLPQSFLLLLGLLVWVCGARYVYDPEGYDYPRERDTSFELDVLMPGVRPTEDDQYICASQPVNEDVYIVDFIPRASMKRVHHMLLYGCSDVDPSYLNGQYSRGCRRGECTGNQVILFAWARDAPSPVIPPDVGFHIGGDSGVRYLTLQIHYGDASVFSGGMLDESGVALKVTYEEQRYLGGIYLMVSMHIDITPHKDNIHSDVACVYDDSIPINMFAFRTHAHGLGKVISGYRIRNNEWEQIAKGNPQWPQAFYPMTNIYSIQRGDTLAARCTFDGTGTDHAVHVGGAHTDEMCNLYLMYYTDSQHGKPFQICHSDGDSSLFRNIPPGSDTPPAEMPRIEGEEDYYNNYNGKDVNKDLDAENDIHIIEDKLKTDIEDHIHEIDAKEGGGTSTSEGTSNDQPTEPPQTETKEVKEEEEESGSRVLNVIPGWPKDVTVGQVGGIDTDSKDDLHVFHRNDRVWDAKSFDMQHRFLKPDEPIQNDTVLVLDKEKGTVKHSWGANQFYMPHGLFVDHNDNVWVTDVALHQVFMYPPQGSSEALLTLGGRLVPGSDDHHFCQPTDVVVDPQTEDFFVSDGYCNSRILKFSKDGQLLLKIDESAIGHLSPSQMNVVHSVTLADNNKQVCVADRENGRILCFFANNGTFVQQYSLPEFGGNVFAAHYSPARGGVFFVINGPSYANKPVMGFTVNFTSGLLLEQWAPKEKFTRPHDVTASQDANEVYVGELEPKKVWKFVDPVPSKDSLPLDSDLARNSLLSHKEMSQDATAIIVVVLAVPIILMMVIAVVVRLHAQGQLKSGRGMFVIGKNRKYANDSFSIGNFFNKRNGFTQVSTDDSDHEGTTWSEESDVEEYSILNSKRTQNL